MSTSTSVQNSQPSPGTAMKPRRVPVYTIIIGLIFLSTMITYFDRVNISILLPFFQHHFGWSTADIGFLSSAFFVGYTVFQIPGGLLADKFGGKWTLFTGSAWWSGFTVLSVLGTSVPLMGTLRALLGVGEAANFPSDTQLTRQWIPQAQRARATGWNLSAIVLGPLIATPLTVWLLQSYGWRSVFYFYGGLGLAWTAVWAWYAKSRPQQHRGVTAAELETIAATVPEVEREALDKPLRSRSVWGLVISYFFLLYSFYLVLTLLPTYLVQARGFSESSLALTATIPYIVAFVTFNLSGYVIDKLTRAGMAAGSARRLMMYIGLVGTGVFTALEALAPSPALAVTGVSIALGFTGLCFSPYWALPIDYSPGSPGLISAVMNTSGNLAGIAAPAVTGILVATTGGWTIALFISAALAVIGAILLAILSRRPPTPSQAATVATA